MLDRCWSGVGKIQDRRNTGPECNTGEINQNRSGEIQEKCRRNCRRNTEEMQVKYRRNTGEIAEELQEKYRRTAGELQEKCRRNAGHKLEAGE